MKPISHAVVVVTLPVLLAVLMLADGPTIPPVQANQPRIGEVTVQRPVAFDTSAPLASLAAPGPLAEDRSAAGRSQRPPNALAPVDPDDEDQAQNPPAPITPPVITTPAGSEKVEQDAQGTKPAATLVASFDGLGIGFDGPQGPGRSGNPSDNTLAVGRDHIVQAVNSRMAIFTKKGKKFDTTGKPLYGSVSTNNVFKGFGGTCEARNNGDAVVRYDQLADRWLIVMPIFGRAAVRPDQPPNWKGGDPTQVAPPGVAGQPGQATPLFQPPPPPPPPPGQEAQRGRGGRGRGDQPQGPYSMCYALSVGPDPFGPYYRYEFLRPLFPDYPRPAVWPDGYYNPSSTGDNRISETVATQKHACVVDRAKMLKGQAATEQCIIIENVGFLNNADLDGKALPPPARRTS